MQEGYVCLDELIREKVPVPVIATAIESVGIYGVDRFSRIQFYSKDSIGKQGPIDMALDALADQWRWKLDSERPGFYEQEPVDINPEDGPFVRFGWPEAERPDFGKYEEGVQIVERPQSQKKRENTDSVIIGALADLIVRDLPQITTVSALADELVATYGRVSGLSNSNLRSRFTEARKVLRDKMEDARSG